MPSGLSGVTAIAAGEAQSLALVVPTNQTITFGALANKTYGDPDFGVGATASSSLAVSFAASGNCTISGAAVHLTGAGSCTVTASQAGNANYNPAPDVARTFSIARATQTITVTLAAPASALVSTSFTVAASAPGGPVSFSSSGVCSNSGAAFTMTSSSGTCTVMFDQSGDANISAAPQVTEAVTAAGGGGGGGGGGGKANQTIAFAALASKTVGDADFALTATASSGLPVAFAATGSCTAAGATVHISGSGSCTATASQAGNGSFNPAPAVSQTFSIAKASQTITFAPLANKTFGAPDFNVNASASSGLAVAFAATGHCALSGTTVHLTGVGSCTVTASQAGNGNFNGAPAVTQRFTVLPKSRAKCTVPRVVGKRLASAQLAIKARNCSTGKVRQALSRTKKGVVIAQNPKPGLVLPPNSRINLVVSRGRRR